ncbi:hypothetical protein D6C95_06595 [Aureobasidium pullulans]|nr:hypothetical protein D6C95_06595 [Aureobasidium pullulans]
MAFASVAGKLTRTRQRLCCFSLRVFPRYLQHPRIARFVFDRQYYTAMPRLKQVVKMKKKKPSNTLGMRDFERSQADLDRKIEQSRSVVDVPFSYPTYTLVSKAALPTCPETCQTCVQHYLPESAVSNPATPRAMVAHSDSEAAKITASYVDGIRNDRDAISAQLEMYGDLLLTRWQRKSVEKRASIVRTTMPEIHARRFSNAWLLYDNKRAFEAQYSTIDQKKFKSRGFEQCLADQMQAVQIHHDSHRKQHLLPFIDVDTLSQDPTSLLALLHYRCNSDIADWVMHDSEQLIVGFNYTMGPPAFNPHCVIMYGTHLGRLIPWNQQSAHRHDIIGYPRAVLILEAQATLFAFLRKTVEALLVSGLQGATAGHQKWDELVESDFGKIGLAPLVGRRLEAFRSPPRVDMASTIECLTAQANAMVDELWLQQTDPQYFRAHLMQAKNNEMYDRMTRWWREEWILEFALCYSVWTDNLRTTLRQALSVLKVQEELGGDIRTGKSLPAGYEAMLVLFQGHLEQLFEGQLRDLQALVPQERSFRDHFNIQDTGKPMLNISSEKLFLANPMLWNMMQLTLKHQSQAPTFHLAFIDHLMREDAKEKNRISPVLATHISNMVVIDDILSSLRYHRPRHGVSVDAEMLARLATGQPRTLPERQQSAFGRIYRLKDPMWEKLQALMKLSLPMSEEPDVLLKHLPPLDDASYEFWEMACVNFTISIGHNNQQEKLYSDPWYLTRIGCTEVENERRALRYAQWKRAADQRGSCKQLQDYQPPKPPSAFSPVAPQQTIWGEPAAPVGAVPSETKPKVKTRPSVSPTDNTTKNPERIADVSPPSPPQASVMVSSKSLTLLTRMFTADPSAPGEINWTEFVSAMADAGCSVMPGGGSCFTFTHVDDMGEEHSMVFHRPHPEPSMSKARLRSFGSRLGRRWGWSLETFDVRV